MRKLRPCVRKLLAGDHPAGLGLRPLAILLPCQGSSPLPWPHLVTAHGGKAGQAVHGTRGPHTRVQEECQGGHVWLVRLCPAQGRPPRSERDPKPGSHSALPAVCPGAGLCLSGENVSSPHSHTSGPGAGRASGEEDVFTGKGLEQSPEMSL